MSRRRPRRGLYAAPAGRMFPALVATGAAAVLGLGVAAIGSAGHFSALSAASSSNVAGTASGVTSAGTSGEATGSGAGTGSAAGTAVSGAAASAAAGTGASSGVGAAPGSDAPAGAATGVAGAGASGSGAAAGVDGSGASGAAGGAGGVAAGAGTGTDGSTGGTRDTGGAAAGAAGNGAAAGASSFADGPSAASVTPPRKPKPWLWTYDVVVTTHFRDDTLAHRAFPTFDLRPVAGNSLPPGVKARAEQVLADVTQQLVQQFDDQAGGLGGKGYALQLDAEVPLRDGPVVAVRLDDASDFKGAHPLVFSRSVVIDLRSGNQVSLGSLLAPGADSRFAAVARAAYLRAGGSYLFPDVLATWSPLDKTWWPQSDGLHLVADQCDIAACAAGEPEVVLPWSQVKPLLSQRGAALLPW